MEVRAWKAVLIILSTYLIDSFISLFLLSVVLLNEALKASRVFGSRYLFKVEIDDYIYRQNIVPFLFDQDTFLILA